MVQSSRKGYYYIEVLLQCSSVFGRGLVLIEWLNRVDWVYETLYSPLYSV